MALPIGYYVTISENHLLFYFDKSTCAISHISEDIVILVWAKLDEEVVSSKPFTFREDNVIGFDRFFVNLSEK